MGNMVPGHCLIEKYITKYFECYTAKRKIINSSTYCQQDGNRTEQKSSFGQQPVTKGMEQLPSSKPNSCAANK